MRKTLVVLSQEPDAADLCLLEEQAQLLFMKRSLEAQLSKAQQQLQLLGFARARLAAVLQERSRVTDLLCHSVSSTAPVHHFSSSSQVFHHGNKVCIYTHIYGQSRTDDNIISTDPYGYPNQYI